MKNHIVCIIMSLVFWNYEASGQDYEKIVGIRESVIDNYFEDLEKYINTSNKQSKEEIVSGILEYWKGDKDLAYNHAGNSQVALRRYLNILDAGSLRFSSDQNRVVQQYFVKIMDENAPTGQNIVEAYLYQVEFYLNGKIEQEFVLVNRFEKIMQTYPTLKEVHGLVDYTLDDIYERPKRKPFLQGGQINGLRGSVVEKYYQSLQEFSRILNANKRQESLTGLLNYWETEDNEAFDQLDNDRDMSIRQYLNKVEVNDVEILFVGDQVIRQFFCQWTQVDGQGYKNERSGFFYEVDLRVDGIGKKEYILISDKGKITLTFGSYQTIRSYLDYFKEDVSYTTRKSQDELLETKSITPTYRAPSFNTILSAKYKKGAKIPLEWTGNPKDTYTLELWKDGKKLSVIANNIGKEEYPVVLYKNYGAGSNYRFKLISKLTELSSTSGNFKIKKKKTWILAPLSIGAAAAVYYLLNSSGDGPAGQVNVNETLPDPPCPSGNDC